MYACLSIQIASFPIFRLLSSSNLHCACYVHPFSVPSFYRSNITNFEARYQNFSSLLLLPPTTWSNRAEHRNILQSNWKNVGSHFRFWQPKIRYITRNNELRRLPSNAQSCPKLFGYPDTVVKCEPHKIQQHAELKWWYIVRKSRAHGRRMPSTQKHRAQSAVQPHTVLTRTHRLQTLVL